MGFPDGGAIASNPIAFCVDGHQWIAISADRVLYVRTLSSLMKGSSP